MWSSTPCCVNCSTIVLKRGGCGIGGFVGTYGNKVSGWSTTLRNSLHIDGLKAAFKLMSGVAILITNPPHWLGEIGQGSAYGQRTNGLTTIPGNFMLASERWTYGL